MNYYYHIGMYEDVFNEKGHIGTLKQISKIFREYVAQNCGVDPDNRKTDDLVSKGGFRQIKEEDMQIKRYPLPGNSTNTRVYIPLITNHYKVAMRC